MTKPIASSRNSAKAPKNSKLCTRMFLIENQLDALITQIYSWNETLYVSDRSSVHRREFFTVHTAMVYVIQVC